MRPQLLIVEMLLADANARFTTGDIDGACRMIAQAALILEPMNQPASLAMAAQIAEAAPVGEVVAVELSSVPELTVEELAQMAEVGPAPIAASMPPAASVLRPAPERPRTMAAAA